MIELDGVVKSYRLKAGKRTVLDHVSATFPFGMRIGILGMNGAGKSTLLRLLAGSEEPDRGRIVRGGRISFPIGFTGTFNPFYSARENVKFLAYIYDMDEAEVIDWVEDFAEIGAYFDMPPITQVTVKAQRILKLKMTDYKTGLKETYAWYKRHRPFPEPDFSFEDRLLGAVFKLAAAAK